eukprot:TRINITY_DN13970_c0_g1_i1.p1 TRINITY_DN13970_c0_g1~~TRINITY_DN13970_c0_g1_i1.p1  ORF type:complete len:111 (-),score=13.29 TRINITY_DN13970_c0_g1_i1:247-579(-)
MSIDYVKCPPNTSEVIYIPRQTRGYFSSEIVEPQMLNYKLSTSEIDYIISRTNDSFKSKLSRQLKLFIFWILSSIAVLFIFIRQKEVFDIFEAAIFFVVSLFIVWAKAKS